MGIVVAITEIQVFYRARGCVLDGRAVEIIARDKSSVAAICCVVWRGLECVVGRIRRMIGNIVIVVGMGRGGVYVSCKFI